jgi:glycosyltransferase involved in cell wall biosynthesis
MRVLLLTQVLPYPLDAGPKVRAYYVLRYLARSHAVTLVSFVRPTDTPAAVAHLAQFCQAVHTLPMPRSQIRDGVYLMKSLVSGQPFLIARDCVPEMGALLDRLLAEAVYDVVHADQLWMAQYALRACKIRGQSDAPLLVLDQHNAVYNIPARMAQGEANPLKRALLLLEAHKMARYEIETCQRFDRVVWVTEEDYAAVQERASAMGREAPNSAVIPICVDPDATDAVRRKPDARRITFLGGLHYPPNAQGILWFAEEVFPAVLAQAPDAVLTVIGKDPPKALVDGRLPVPGRNLEVTGYVGDLEPYLAETAVFVVPLLAGGGMRVKILDAWAWGLPVVSTSIGAEGLEVREGENILLADTPLESARAVARVMKDVELARQLADSGRCWVEERYDWRIAYVALEAVYRDLLHPSGRPDAASGLDLGIAGQGP